MPLKVSTKNPRYFEDSTGNAVLLTGSHTWSNLQDQGSTSSGKLDLDFDRYTDWMKANNQNFMRLWAWENPAGAAWRTDDWRIDPMPFARTGPGVAADGKPKFDLTKFSQNYFDELRERVIEAGQDGIYVSVMLFQGWSLEDKNQGGVNPWKYHPFNKDNNINNVNGDPGNTGKGNTTHTTNAPAGVETAQKAYVRKVIDTLNDLDNVLYEISNESLGTSAQWQHEMIGYIKDYEATKPKQHPVGMTMIEASHDKLFNSDADWISPGAVGGYGTDPPAANGSKVILSDTDHIWGMGGDASWVWKSFTRGLNPIMMDDLKSTSVYPGGITDGAGSLWPPSNSSDGLYTVRLGMKQIADYAEKIDLDSAKPSGSLTSTGYMLADPGDQYLAFSPSGGTFTVNLSAGAGEKFTVEWLNVNTGAKVTSATISGGSTAHSFTAPFSGPAALFLDDVEGSDPRPAPEPEPQPTVDVTPTNTTIGEGQ